MTQTAPELDTAIKGFLDDLAVGHSPATVKTYRMALNRFSQYLAQQNEPSQLPSTIDRLQTDWAIDFLRAIAAGQLPANPANRTTQVETQVETQAEPLKVSKATLATYSAALLRFYNWCATEQLVSLSTEEYARFTRRLRDLRGKTQRTIINKVPPDEVIEKLLAQVRLAEPPAASDSGASEYDRYRYRLLQLRNTALLETLKSTGARVSELCGLTRGDLDAVNRRARVIGKGSKERWVYFGPTAWQTLQDYLAARATGPVRATPPGEEPIKEPTRRRDRAGALERQPLFCRHDRGAGLATLKPLAPRSIENMLWQLVETAGLETYITPHKFRHWFATRMLAATGDLATTQDLLGHASPTTTRIYAQVSEQRKQTAHREVFGQPE